ncbi:hypothetical protein HRJ35_06280 [Shewanella oneidensis MR-1]|jgi:hypothetical protein|uniref:Uncharacterized protein n=1 Tax=Shewanella oneidensis (strain ATCC 700550 / JCM 31522 / CIP 106686 / LMG 19005 / NCIMB 14063 / MR-1) TaxID=211586 RepID=Q8EIQ5_SHEON|nr:hypothetical protein [Shewanella oneidensis]AAN53858.1 uncharacterized protein SO_0782 [Shewanella oneidensis MR-1]MDX5997310.1 hypothetical protein [Shewanella oneidensis]MEE2029885.1 hypothetical protein [Shewanella oneidensis]QKG95650.1 hypothetical protein HRJ35_06280 [Shewanella oneidensis MR-1]
MNTFFYNKIPRYFIENLTAVREPIDNLWNVLVVIEAINSSPDCLIKSYEHGFDIALFSTNFKRFLIKKIDGYFSMSNPFQVIVGDENISFTCDIIKESVSGIFISIMKNAITTYKENNYSHEESILSMSYNFNLEIAECIKYYDAFVYLISGEHGYFRFDDDPVNSNNHIHPRYHLDIFCTNSSTLKIGTQKIADLSTFMALADKTIDKKYLADSPLVL